MRKRALGLSWIKESNKEQHEWAYYHLAAKGRISPQWVTPNYDQLLEIGDRLESEGANGLLIIKAMRDAWRQYKHRSPSKGRKPYSFTLPISVKKSLDALAKSNATNETSATSVLISLIEDATSDVAHQKKWLKEANERSKSALESLKKEVADYKLAIQEQEKHLNQCLLELCRYEASSKEGVSETLEALIEALYEQKKEAITNDINEEIAKVPSLKNKLNKLTRVMDRNTKDRSNTTPEPKEPTLQKMQHMQTKGPQRGKNRHKRGGR